MVEVVTGPCDRSYFRDGTIRRLDKGIKILMLFRTCTLLVALLLAVATASAAQRKDPRMIPISQQQIQQQVQHTPLRSHGHLETILKARSSGFAKTVYEQYALKQKQNPNDPYAKLWLGIAADEYLDYAGSPFVNSLSSSQAYKFRQQVRSNLAGAVEALPNSALANARYGFFLWQDDNQMSKGLALVKKSVSLDPKEPVTHVTLARIYSNATGNAYDPAKAKESVDAAIRLDPSFAYPHWVKAGLHINSKEYDKAQRDMQAYLSLAPPTFAQNPAVKHRQSYLRTQLAAQ